MYTARHWTHHASALEHNFYTFPLCSRATRTRPRLQTHDECAIGIYIQHGHNAVQPLQVPKRKRVARQFAARHHAGRSGVLISFALAIRSDSKRATLFISARIMYFCMYINSWPAVRSRTHQTESCAASLKLALIFDHVRTFVCPDGRR